MGGRAKARQQDAERDFILAWHIEALHREKKLKRIFEYLSKAKPKKPKSPEEILAVMRELQARGAGFEIREVEAAHGD